MYPFLQILQEEEVTITYLMTESVAFCTGSILHTAVLKPQKSS